MSKLTQEELDNMKRLVAGLNGPTSNRGDFLTAAVVFVPKAIAYIEELQLLCLTELANEHYAEVYNDMKARLKR